MKMFEAPGTSSGGRLLEDCTDKYLHFLMRCREGLKHCIFRGECSPEWTLANSAGQEGCWENLKVTMEKQTEVCRQVGVFR